MAIMVFMDPFLIVWYDEGNSGFNKYGAWEDRYIALGNIGEILCVVYTVRERNNEEIIRVISARLAEGAEVDDYLSRRGDII